MALKFAVAPSCLFRVHSLDSHATESWFSKSLVIVSPYSLQEVGRGGTVDRLY